MAKLLDMTVGVLSAAAVVKDALERLQWFPANNIPRFKIVQNVKNVDVSSARMVSVLDLLGYMYIVPWHMVRTAEQMRFFLRFFTAGGSILDWTHDYVIVDDENTELTPANWESGARHGISIILHLGNRDGLVALQDMLRSRIRGILSTSAVTFQEQGIQDVFEKVCLLVGASKAQFEIRDLVKDAVVKEWGNHDKRYGSSSSVAGQASANPSSSCLICRGIYARFLDLANHAYGHLIALSCARNCSTCDAEELPDFANEDVSQRSERRASEAKVERPLVNPPKFSVGSRPPRGSWICCRCRQTNMPNLTSPERYPMDGHFQCSSCARS